MLCAVFNFLSLVYCTRCASGTERKRSQVVVSRGIGKVWGRIVENQTGHFQYTPQIATCALLNYVTTRCVREIVPGVE